MSVPRKILEEEGFKERKHFWFKREKHGTTVYTKGSKKKKKRRKK